MPARRLPRAARLLATVLAALVVLGAGTSATLATYPRIRQARDAADLEPGLLRVYNAARGRVLLAGDVFVELYGSGLRISRAGHIIWEGVPQGSFVGAALGSLHWREHLGMSRAREDVTRSLANLKVKTRTIAADSITYTGLVYDDAGALPVRFTITRRPDGRVLLDAQVPGADAVVLHGKRENLEGLHGGGEQFADFDLAGGRWPVVSREQGVGRGEQPLTALADLTKSGAGGDAATTYAPMPFYLSTRLNGLALDTTAYSVLDFSHGGRSDVTVWQPRLSARLYDASSPRELVIEHTADAGRMHGLPDWALRGAILGVQGGSAAVRRKVALMRQAGTRIAAVWVQDWVGRRRTSFGDRLWWTWQPDRALYPDWDRLVADLRAQGIRVLTYVNPMLVDPTVPGAPRTSRDLYDEARRAGYLVARADGTPYLADQGGFDAAMVDLTNPAAVDWFTGVIADEVAAGGVAGWMADFGEGPPMDAQLHAGTPATERNSWPQRWAALNRAACQRAGIADCLVWQRSADEHAPGDAVDFWQGDQMTDWSAQDGLRSALLGKLSGGVSGMTLLHSDVGGYTSVALPLWPDPRRSDELLERWAELEALGTTLRTHEGNRPDANPQVYDSQTRRTAFARASRIFAATADYRAEQVEVAARTGLPVVRPVWLEVPGGGPARAQDEFFFGSSFLVVPALEDGQRSVRAHLPRGRWVEIWSGRTYGDADADSVVSVPAPLGRPVLMYRDGDPQGPNLREALRRQGVL